MKTKIKYSLLALLMILSTVVSTVSTVTPAYAAPVDTASIDDQAKAFLYYRSLSGCFASTAVKNPISPADIVSGSWFYNSPTVAPAIGYIGSDKGTVNCDDAGFVSSAITLYGYTGKLEAYCDLMKDANVKRDDGSACTSAGTSNITTSGDRLTSSKKAIETKYFGGQGNHGDPGYLMYYIGVKQFEARCADRIKPFAQASTDEKSTGFSMTIVNDAGVKEEWLYKGKAGVNLGDTGVQTFVLADNSGFWPSCSGSDTNNSIKGALIDKYVDAYVTWFSTHKPITCKDQYVEPDTAGQAACDAGFKNKTDAAYCDTTYPAHPDKTPENAACVFGRDTAAGGANGVVANPDVAAKDKTSCVIDGIGWIICPVVNFAAKLVDAAYSFVAGLLVIQPIMTTGGSKGIYDTWSIMRNFANVAFVIVFLIIIFSQLTSVGISNYGVKKMLPRLVAAAILVNISFWVCSIAVDISNIIGASVNDIFKSVTDDVSSGPSGGSFGATSHGWEGIAGSILAGTVAAGALLFVGLSALLPALVIVLIAIVTVFIVLTVRQALIILLIVISPLAFVAFLLPNTESLFKKWRGLFQTLLLMYPVIGLMFGASALASKVIMSTAKGNIALEIAGAMVAIVPLALTPIIMKAAGGVLGKVGAFVNNPNKGPFDRMKKGARNVVDDKKVTRGIRALDENKRSMLGRKTAINRRNRIDTQRSGRQEQFKDLQSESILNKAVSDPKFAASVAGANAVSYQAKAQGQLNKIDKEKIENEEFLLKAKFRPDQLVPGVVAELKEAITTANDITKPVSVREAATTKARAATSILATQTGSKGLGELRETLATHNPLSNAEGDGVGDGVGDMIRRDISNAGLKGRDAGLDTWSRKDKDTELSTTSGEAGTWSGLSHEQIAGQTLGAITAAGNSGGLSAQTAAEVLGNSKISGSIGAPEKAELQRIAGSVAPTVPITPQPGPAPQPAPQPAPGPRPTPQPGPAPQPAPQPAPAGTTTSIWPGGTVRTRPRNGP